MYNIQNRFGRQVVYYFFKINLTIKVGLFFVEYYFKENITVYFYKV